MTHVVMFSGGIGSWAAATRVPRQTGDRLVLLFADTLIEDVDLYRFLEDAATSLGGEFVRVCEGRTPWEVFRDVKFLGNTRIDPCSRILKREALRAWLTEHCEPDQTRVYLGIDWTEVHRMDRAARFWAPWTCLAPLTDPPYLTPRDYQAMLAAAGLTPPRLYAMGFPHNNCGGFCVKAGHAQFALLYQRLPERYREHEAHENEIREQLGDVAILRDRTGGTTTPLPLTVFRQRLEANDQQLDLFEWGGCSCFFPDEGV